MRQVLKKIHIYLGLMNSCAFTVFGIAGLTATFQAEPSKRAPHTSVEYRDFTAPPNLSDKQVADLVYRRLRFPLSQPIPAWALHRDDHNLLELNFWTLNVTHKVTVIEPEHRLRIENVHRSVWDYLNDMHTLTLNGNPPYFAIRLWQYYNEFALWSLVLMVLSGVYLWLASRQGFRWWALYALASGAGIFAALYIATR